MQLQPTHIVVTCPHCGYGNVFHQPYPYHAGYGDQGFLYNESGNCTLSWSSFDRDYVGVVGLRHPWDLTAADREALEARLAPAPDGTRWSFKNPARCLRCGGSISGPITETPYFLRYEGSVDRDVRCGWGAGLKDVLRRVRTAVPWSVRDVWLGVAAAAVIIALSYVAVYVLSSLQVRPNVDIWEGVFPTVMELLFLVPVWWFVRHKRGASFTTLGFRKFPWAWFGIGFAMLVGAYIFNGYYAFLLSLLGQQMREDATPIIEQLATPWPLVFSVVIVAPFVEETFFRGFVFAGLRARMDWWWAAIISAAVFAAAHGELLFFVPAFVFGLLFAFVYQRTNSVWPGMFLHFFVNAVAMTLMLVLS